MERGRGQRQPEKLEKRKEENTNESKGGKSKQGKEVNRKHQKREGGNLKDLGGSRKSNKQEEEGKSKEGG